MAFYLHNFRFHTHYLTQQETPLENHPYLKNHNFLPSAEEFLTMQYLLPSLSLCLSILRNPLNASLLFMLNTYSA
jgi:hypothetical protein